MALGVAATTGCGLQAAPEEYESGAMGTNGEVGDMLLRSVHVEAPPDPNYEPGANARLWVTFVNESREQDTLTSVTTPVATRTEIRWDADCDGEMQAVPALPLRPAGPAVVQSPAGIPPFDAYHVRLVDLTRQVIAGTSIPVTFTFERAGQITMEAHVQPSIPRAEPTSRCFGSAAPAVPTAATSR